MGEACRAQSNGQWVTFHDRSRVSASRGPGTRAVIWLILLSTRPITGQRDELLIAGVRWIISFQVTVLKKGRKLTFYLTTLSTHFILWLCGVGHIYRYFNPP